MLNTIITNALRYKVLIIALFIVVIIMGVDAYKKVPIDAFPDITPKQVVIYTESVGNSAEDIEKLITYPIEASLSGMAGVKSIVSNSLFGLSYVAVFFEEDKDIYFLRQLVNERLSTIDIPKGWGKPTLGPNTTGLGQVFWYEIDDSKNKYSLQEIRQMQEVIVTPLFKSISGVEEVISWGGEQKQYNILIDTHKLQLFNITYDDVIHAVERSNSIAGGQYLEFNREQYLIRGIGLYRSLEDIGNSVISSSQSKSITIKDVATIKEGYAPRFGAISIDGNESVIGMVLQRTGTNASKVVQRLKAKISTINKTLPKGVSIKVIYDRSEITDKAVATMSLALLSGVSLVAVILFLFLFEIRSALIVITSLPISLLIAYILMQYFGLSANLMSLSGLAIAVGMIVDGTIVMVENSFRKLSENSNTKDKNRLILEASLEVAKPITFAILIIVAVFIPLLSLDGLAGKLYKPMAQNIVFVMLGSLVVALILIPVLNLLLLRPKVGGDSKIMQSIKRVYTPTLSFAFKYTKGIIISTILVFVVAITLLIQQGREFMPSLNEESIMYRVIAIPGTSLSQSTQSAKEIERYILENYSSSVISVLSMIGRSEKGESAQANYMEILLTLKDNIDNLSDLRIKMDSDLSEYFEHIRFVPTQPIAMRIEELLEGVQSDLAIKIYGEEQKKLTQIANSIQKTLKGVEGLKGMEIESQLGQASIEIYPDYLALARYGIGVDEVMRLIRNGIGEEPISYKIEGVNRYGIVAKIKDSKKDIDALKNITFRSKNGSIVILEQICDISITQGASFIKRENLSRYMVLSLHLKDRDVASFVKEANNIISQIDMPVGYYIGWAGDFKNMQEATEKLMIIIPMTLMLILLLLYTFFASLSKSLLILMNVPFGLIGGIISLLISGIYLSISAIIGFLAIFAIAILNGIVLVSFIDEKIALSPNKSLKSIIEEATLLRLRPVLMTAFTTLFGILPLLYASGVGSEIHYPLSVVIIGGVISSTLLTLIVLPVGYYWFFKK